MSVHPYSAQLGPMPKDERLRISWISGLLDVAYRRAAYDLTAKGDWRCFGGIEPELATTLVERLDEALELVNEPICGPTALRAR